MNILITGGAGFIGINTAKYYLDKGNWVKILDNFSRTGSKQNMEWLKKMSNRHFAVINDDLRNNSKLLKKAVEEADLIIHLAGQVAVTKSVENPREDFESNLLGTFNVLESIRKSKNQPVLIYSSTNKVYGALPDIKIKELKTRYSIVGLPLGVSEEQNLDFHSPYGCSKGAADQYVRDYARIYNLKTIVFRQSCIYGPRQFGIEDQGWLAWFIISISRKQPINIYGTGKQVRDILYIDDLIDAYDKAFNKIEITSGQIYNIGGGIDNSISIWFELKPILEKLFGFTIRANFLQIRPGDQPIFISNINKAKTDFAWEPKVSTDEGIRYLYNWIITNKSLFEHLDF